MSDFKVVTIIGARPQFIKAASLSRSLKKHNIHEIIIHTGQHYDDNMSEVFFREMEIPNPNYRLNDLGNLHGEMTGTMLIGIEKILLKEKPNLVIVFGDTNTTLAGALAARKLNIKVAHIEAGVRNWDMTMPEEINRILVDHMSDYLFCPTPECEKNLKEEGIEKAGGKIYLSGDILVDTINYYKSLVPIKSTITIPKEKYILTTIHRAANTELDSLTEIFKALNEIAKTKKIIFPLHPRTQKYLTEHNITPSTNIQIMAPVGYFDLLNLLVHCDEVITDSGGLQREAYFMGKKSLMLLNPPLWKELVDSGNSLVCDSIQNDILATYTKLIKTECTFSDSHFGKGDTGEIVVSKIMNVQHN